MLPAEERDTALKCGDTALARYWARGLPSDQRTPLDRLPELLAGGWLQDLVWIEQLQQTRSASQDPPSVSVVDLETERLCMVRLQNQYSVLREQLIQQGYLESLLDYDLKRIGEIMFRTCVALGVGGSARFWLTPRTGDRRPCTTITYQPLDTAFMKQQLAIRKSLQLSVSAWLSHMQDVIGDSDQNQATMIKKLDTTPQHVAAIVLAYAMYEAQALSCSHPDLIAETIRVGQVDWVKVLADTERSWRRALQLFYQRAFTDALSIAPKDVLGVEVRDWMPRLRDIQQFDTRKQEKLATLKQREAAHEHAKGPARVAAKQALIGFLENQDYILLLTDQEEAVRQSKLANLR